MSAIQKELCKACSIDPAKYAANERASLHADIVKAVNKLEDKEWEKLSVEAQDWFNAAADATKAKKPVAEFPDFKAEEPETRSRRRSSEDEPPAKAKSETMAVEKLQEGDRVKLTTKRGKVIEGEVLENSKRKEYVVVKGSDGEDEVDWDKVDSVEVFHGTAGQPEDTGPQVGDEVSFKTTRGKQVTGVITELEGDTIVLDKTDDYQMDRIDGDIKIVKKGGGSGGAAAKKEEPETRSRSASKGKDDDGDKKSRSTNDKGVSVGGRIRELMAEDPTRTKEAVDKILTREKIEYREASLNIIFRDCQNLIKLLRDNGHMKAA